MNTILQSIYGIVTYCLVFNCGKSIVRFIQSWFLTHCRIVKLGCLIRPFEAEPTPTLQRVDDSLGDATVFS